MSAKAKHAGKGAEISGQNHRARQTNPTVQWKPKEKGQDLLYETLKIVKPI